ncbi:hypothetical protein [Haloplasma contractile]|uniref:Cytosolic protein n=1 Tax=Haloplasma contractile SSD-17B TaxID=1033810 RepID=U2FJR7_9MOLU|nr:hypothetical protein [Haloplasma contractile]ERJ11499.1 hypothetical protein HLPCO_002411 [Haloplasma contractile SSD-17B]
MGFFDYFSNQAETKERHKVDELKTHYYKTNYQHSKDAVIKYINEHKMNVKHVDDNYGEIFVQERSYHMVISIRQINPIETAIDIKVNTYRLVGAYKARKLILQMYKELDATIPFKGVALHP